MHRRIGKTDSHSHAKSVCVSWVYGVWASQHVEASTPLPASSAGIVFALLERALSELLASAHFQILLKTLCFVYTHVGRLPSNGMRLELLRDLLFDRFFFSLFLHWCPEVRRQFHHILVYRLNRAGAARQQSEIEIRTTSSRSHSHSVSQAQSTTSSHHRSHSGARGIGGGNGVGGGSDADAEVLVSIWWWWWWCFCVCRRCSCFGVSCRCSCSCFF